MWNVKNNTSINNVSGEFMNESYSVPTSATENKKTESNYIIPVTVQQLYKDTPDSFTVGGHLASVVCFFGLVRKIDTVATKITFEIEDETGTITALRWLETEDRDDDIQVNKYARIIGKLREQADIGRYFFILNIEPVKKISVIYSHLLEITDRALHEEQGVENGTESTNGHVTNDGGDGVIQGLDKDSSLVLQIIRDCLDNDNGIQKSDLASKLPSHITTTQADKIIEFLTSEGHIYTTFTDDYFKAT